MILLPPLFPALPPTLIPLSLPIGPVISANSNSYTLKNKGKYKDKKKFSYNSRKYVGSPKIRLKEESMEL